MTFNNNIYNNQTNNYKLEHKNLSHNFNDFNDDYPKTFW